MSARILAESVRRVVDLPRSRARATSVSFAAAIASNTASSSSRFANAS